MHAMLRTLLGFVDRTKRAGPALRVYLWWGILLRTVLLAALGTLLIVEGNFLSEWILSWQVVPVQPDELEEFTVVSYVVLGLVMSVGAYLRWAVLRQMDALQAEAEGGEAAETEDAGSARETD